MSEIHHAFFGAVKHKRKRSENDISGISSERVIKRPTNLAFRLSPKSRPTSLFSDISAYSPFSGQLTPVDTSEDESVTQEDIWAKNSRLPDLSDSVESTSSIKVQVSSPDSHHDHSNAIADTDMDTTPSTTIRPRIGRARSNDILSSPPRRLTPPRAATLLSPATTTAFPHDRAPTPISGHFASYFLSNAPSAPRHNFPPIHTDLSPMIEQDAWGSLNSATTKPHHQYGPNNLPSPADDNIIFSSPTSPTIRNLSSDENNDDADMQLDEATTSSMSTLTVSGNADDSMETELAQSHNLSRSSSLQRRQHQPHRSGWNQHPTSTIQGHVRNTSSQSGRTARLHMGFMAGCEKCTQKVPGHYSHILWSKD